jgi:TonB-dependent receptor
MKNMKLNAISISILASLALPIVNAAENETENEQTTAIEVIEVTGFKSSLRKAINAKRYSDGVVDSIHAEDVGKSTDQNIADALSRVTGVTVQEQDGEGTKISVRGAGPALNQISMNGIALTSGLSGGGDNAVADQSVDLSSFSSDILASIDVQKTASADQDEGSLGANIVLRTVRPLSLKNPKRTVEVQGRYNDYSGEFDRKISASFSDKFLDDNLGIIFTIADETQSTRVDEFKMNWDDEVHTVAANKSRDAKTGELISTETDFISPADAEYKLNTNKRDRLSATAGIQFLPTETTEVQIDLNYSKQDTELDNQRFNMQFGLTDPNPATDPQEDWWTINQENHTLEKRLMRRSKARIYRQLDGQEVENKLASFNIKQTITDSLSADLTMGYSRTTSGSKENANILLTPAGNTTDTPLVSNSPTIPYLEPSGIDCTTGVCNLVAAEQLSLFQPGSINNSAALVPNISNPLDTSLFKVANVNQDLDDNSDTNKSIFLDFDWDIEFLGVNKVEFGGKSTNRVKDVSTLRTTITDATSLLDENGEPISIPGGLSSLRMVDVLGSGAFPVDNFMEDIVTNRQEFLNGWGVVDPFKALAYASGDGRNVRTKEDPTGSRVIEQDVSALYAKLNFEYFDGFVTGNVGLRYVKTKTAAEAYTKINYQGNANVYDVSDLVYNQQLANTSLPTCGLNTTDNPVSYPDNNNNQYPTNLPAAGTCHEPTFIYDFHTRDLEGGTIPIDLQTPDNTILDVLYDIEGNVVGIDNNSINTSGRNGRFPRNANVIKAWADRLTNINNVVDGETIGTTASQRFVINNDSASNSLLLPSINLNFALTDDLIGRFSASKTMARPGFDDTRPSGNITEDIFKVNGSGKINNTALKPLESKNLDLSLEWYFNESGLLSVAYFRKDMKNFTESIAETYLWKDLRTNYNLDGVANLDDVLLTPTPLLDDNGQQKVDEFTNLPMWEETPYSQLADGSTCMPDRSSHSNLSQPWTLNCHTLVLDVKRNGKGALTQGIEFNYTQVYDFLPGALSGLGLSVNYTFADSESEKEILETTGKVVSPLPQPFTPRHSANTTLFWEKDGLMMRLAHRYNSVQLVNRNIADGNAAEWSDATSRLDFSSSYKLNDTISLTFQALNLTDDINRTFLTSTGFVVNGEVLDEGNAMTDNVDTSRTTKQFKTGRQYRVGIRGTF